MYSALLLILVSIDLIKRVYIFATARKYFFIVTADKSIVLIYSIDKQ